jgi:Ser/Thr protein kinase RdoA (MazF antagonist)
MTLEIGSLSDDGAAYWDGDGNGWQPLWLRPADVRHAAVACYGVEAPTVQYLASGMLNQSWRVGDFVLRISRPGRTREQLLYEHHVLTTLNQEAPEVLAPVTGIDGHRLQRVGQRWLTMFPYVEGVLGSDLPQGTGAQPTAAMMAKLHRLSQRLLFLPQRPGYHASDVQSQWIWPRLAPMLRREIPSASSYFALFDNETAQIAAWLDTKRRENVDLPRAVVQGDTNPRNLIFDHSGSNIAAVIDWDECQVDVLHAVVAREAFAPGVRPDEFWDTYIRSGGPLQADSIELLFGFARLGGLMDLMWTDHQGRANPHALTIMRDVGAAIERLRGVAPLA